MTTDNPLSLAQAARRLLSAMEEGKKSAVMAVVAHPEPSRIGMRVLFLDGERTGSFGDPGMDEAALQLAIDGLEGDPGILPGLHRLRGSGDAEAVVYLELHHPPSELVIVGAGHLAQPLCTVGALLGLDVRVLDDRPDFATRERFPEAAEVTRVDFADPFQGRPLHPWSHVLLVTRGHRHDYECLRKVLQHERLPAYIGMIGSRRRVRATFEALLEEGFSRDILRQVRAPIGLDIGGQTPAEIAISVAAEMVRSWRGGSCLPMKDVERVLDRLISADTGPGGEAPGEGEDR